MSQDSVSVDVDIDEFDVDAICDLDRALQPSPAVRATTLPPERFGAVQ